VGPPPAAVLEAYGLTADPVRLRGGQQRSWRAGGVVLKPLDMAPVAIQWQADLLVRLSRSTDLRVSVPLRTSDGRLVVQGWTVWSYEPGSYEPEQWGAVLEVGRRLHALLADGPRPAFLDGRDDRWATADRVAWGELALPPGSPHLDRLLAALRPRAHRSQVVHGDLTRNVLFADHLPPLVIDLSPYWRPAGYAEAVVLADALLHEGAEHADVAPLVDDPQHLLRALVYRAVSDADEGRLGRAVDVAVRLAGGQA